MQKLLWHSDWICSEICYVQFFSCGVWFSYISPVLEYCDWPWRRRRGSNRMFIIGMRSYCPVFLFDCWHGMSKFSDTLPLDWMHNFGFGIGHFIWLHHHVDKLLRDWRCKSGLLDRVLGCNWFRRWMRWKHPFDSVCRLCVIMISWMDLILPCQIMYMLLLVVP